MAWTATCEGQRRSWQQTENSEYIAERLLAQATMAVVYIARLSRASVADRFAQAAAAEFNGGLMTACHPAGTSGLSVGSPQWGRAVPSLPRTASEQALSGEFSTLQFLNLPIGKMQETSYWPTHRWYVVSE